MIEIKQLSSNLMMIDRITDDDVYGDRYVINKYLDEHDNIDVVTNQNNIRLFDLDNRVTSISDYLSEGMSCL